MNASKVEIRESDKPILKAIFLNGSSIGDEASELAAAAGCTTQRLIAVAKRYSGIRFNAGTITYIGPDNYSVAKAAPGIANARHGIGGYIPATICVKRQTQR